MFRLSLSRLSCSMSRTHPSTELTATHIETPRRWIHSVNITGKVAMAVIGLDYPNMRARDHMSLLKFDDDWCIVVKAYEAVTQ